MQRAGFALPVADSVSLRTEYKDTVHLMHDLREMGETNALSQRQRSWGGKDIFLRTAEIYRENFATDSGRIKATYDIVFLTGWAPDGSQPQPLRPGSAKQRLADALKVPEVPLRD